MSSHHIVREKQEPALYIHEFGEFDEEKLGQLLEWSPVVLVAASEYEKALSLGIKIDVFVGSDASVLFQENTRFVYAADSAMQHVLSFLVAEKYPAVNIISKENRFDKIAHFLPEINIVLFTENDKSYAIKPGFSVWKPKGFVFKIDIIRYFETSNLMPGENGEFIVMEDGFVHFSFSGDYLFLTELL